MSACGQLLSQRAQASTQAVRIHSLNKHEGKLSMSISCQWEQQTPDRHQTDAWAQQASSRAQQTASTQRVSQSTSSTPSLKAAHSNDSTPPARVPQQGVSPQGHAGGQQQGIPAPCPSKMQEGTPACRLDCAAGGHAGGQ